GEAGIRGDRGGDLVVRIEITPHEAYQRQGDDLFCQVTIDSFGAMLGTSVELDGILEGERVRVDIPAGCQYGEQVTVEGHGMPRLGSSARGNLIAVVEVLTPTNLTEERRQALRELLGDDAPAASDDDKRASGKAWHFRGRKNKR
ncbi:MAG: DnaJ C-terminal domain-containing protein, partial [Coriobacteriales bacterium]|nr:DnaJ C-terminal domain-containing protein [Coriobacteriales bacterium]